MCTMYSARQASRMPRPRPRVWICLGLVEHQHAAGDRTGPQPQPSLAAAAPRTATDHHPARTNLSPCSCTGVKYGACTR